MDEVKKKKVIQVRLHGHAWPVYPLICRKKITCRVTHRVDGERRGKSFTSLAKAKAQAKDFIKEIFEQGESKIHLSAQEKLDWKSAVAVLKHAGIHSSLESVCRQYADLAAVAGGQGLLADIVRKHVTNRAKEHIPVKLSKLKELYVSTMKGQARSERYVQALNSFCGIFERAVGGDMLAHDVTRETLQNFLNQRKVGPRGKQNFAEAIRTMFDFAKSRRHIPEEWDEIDHVTLPLVKHGSIPTYTPEEGVSK